jgi:predicted permease
VRHALRRLRTTPAFTLTALVTLGAAIGANALVFSVVNGVLLKPLPFADPDRLVGVWHVAPGLMEGDLNQSPATYLTYRDNGVFQDIGMWRNSAVAVTGRGDPERLDALMVTDGTLPLLGVRPALGRLFTPEDDAPGSAQTVILTHAYWLRAFGGNPNAINQSMVLDGTPYQIIGVLPEDFRFLRSKPALVLPFRFNRAELFVGNFSYQAVARLKPGSTMATASADIARLIPNIPDNFRMPPGFSRQMFDEVRLGPNLRPLAKDVIGDIDRILWVLLGTMGIVLLVACANIANLFLVRAEGRQQELAVRAALGASVGQVVVQLLSEALILGLGAGVLGLALAGGGIRLLVALNPAELPRLDEIALDPVVIVFTLALSIVAGLLFGLIPVLKYANPRLAATLKEGGRGSSDGRERHRARNTLVVAQVALALVLLIGSGLMVRTFVAMRNVPPGFVNPEDVLTLRVAIPESVIKDPLEAGQALEQMRERIAALAGVSSVAMASSITMDGNDSNDPIWAEDKPAVEGQMPPLKRYKWIAPGLFATMGNPLLAGRDFTWEEIHARTPVVIVNEKLAREFWGEPAAAIGKRIRNTPKSPYREIVGVVGDERDDGVARPAPAIAYWPMAMNDWWDQPIFVNRYMGFAIRTPRVRTPNFLREVQQAVWSVNPNVPVARVQTLEDLYKQSMAETSFALVILGIAAAVTLLLGLVGIYGVIAYIVAQRRREVGIRMAIGASGADVQRLFVRRGLVLTGLGLAVGVVVALGVMRLIAALLFGVTPFDPLTYVAVIIVLGSVALLATWLPARQASLVDPAISLRSE